LRGLDTHPILLDSLTAHVRKLQADLTLDGLIAPRQQKPKTPGKRRSDPSR
jgi:hypothetical protein